MEIDVIDNNDNNPHRRSDSESGDYLPLIVCYGRCKRAWTRHRFVLRSEHGSVYQCVECLEDRKYG